MLQEDFKKPATRAKSDLEDFFVGMKIDPERTPKKKELHQLEFTKPETPPTIRRKNPPQIADSNRSPVLDQFRQDDLSKSGKSESNCGENLRVNSRISPHFPDTFAIGHRSRRDNHVSDKPPNKDVLFPIQLGGANSNLSTGRQQAHSDGLVGDEHLNGEASSTVQKGGASSNWSTRRQRSSNSWSTRRQRLRSDWDSDSPDSDEHSEDEASCSAQMGGVNPNSSSNGKRGPVGSKNSDNDDCFVLPLSVNSWSSTVGKQPCKDNLSIGQKSQRGGAISSQSARKNSQMRSKGTGEDGLFHLPLSISNLNSTASSHRLHRNSLLTSQQSQRDSQQFKKDSQQLQRDSCVSIEQPNKDTLFSLPVGGASSNLSASGQSQSRRSVPANSDRSNADEWPMCKTNSNPPATGWNLLKNDPQPDPAVSLSRLTSGRKSRKDCLVSNKQLDKDDWSPPSAHFQKDKPEIVAGSNRSIGNVCLNRDRSASGKNSNRQRSVNDGKSNREGSVSRNSFREGSVSDRHTNTSESVSDRRTNTSGYVSDRRNNTNGSVSDRHTNTSGSVSNRHTNTSGYVSDRHTNTSGSVSVRRTNTSGYVSDRRTNANGSVSDRHTNTSGSVKSKNTSVSSWMPPSNIGTGSTFQDDWSFQTSSASSSGFALQDHAKPEQTPDNDSQAAPTFHRWNSGQDEKDEADQDRPWDEKPKEESILSRRRFLWANEGKDIEDNDDYMTTVNNNGMTRTAAFNHFIMGGYSIDASYKIFERPYINCARPPRIRVHENKTSVLRTAHNKEKLRILSEKERLKGNVFEKKKKVDPMATSLRHNDLMLKKAWWISERSSDNNSCDSSCAKSTYADSHRDSSDTASSLGNHTYARARASSQRSPSIAANDVKLRDGRSPRSVSVGRSHVAQTGGRQSRAASVCQLDRNISRSDRSRSRRDHSVSSSRCSRSQR